MNWLRGDPVHGYRRTQRVRYETTPGSASTLRNVTPLVAARPRSTSFPTI